MITDKTDDPPRPPTRESTPLEELDPKDAERITDRDRYREPLTRREVEVPEAGEDDRSKKTPRHAEPGSSPETGEQP